MINLCNDVLNKERRNLFPKIPTLDNKLSLYSLIFLKQQNPYKFYKSFYDKMLIKTNKNLNKESKNNFKHNSFLSLLSKTQNYFYSVPIKYRYKPQQMEIKYNENQKNNNFNNKMAINKENSLINKSNSNARDLLNNKNLKVIHEYLVKNNDNNNLNKKKRNQSCKDIYMESDNDESESDNSIINDKVSRGQQTISNNDINCFENKNCNEIENYNNFKKDIKHKNEKLIKYRIKKEEKKKKFTINFEKKKSEIYKKKNNSCTNKINIIWKNLRRPITMKFGASFKLH